MAFSYTRIILEDCEFAVFERGRDLSKQTGKVEITPTGNNQCRAMAFGTQTYDVWLGFNRVGSPKYICSCPYVTQHKTKMPCKHTIASSLLWDKSRNVPAPSDDEAKSLCPEEPEISYADIKKAYADPIHADLHVIRIAADKLGSWSRSHSRLPDRPAVCERDTLTLTHVKEGLSEIQNWSRRSAFDLYFCAGEIMAAFCELIRWARSRIESIPAEEQVSILKQLVQFQETLVVDTIDDSDGLHEFSSAHLVDLVRHVTQLPDTPKESQSKLQQLYKWAKSIEHED